MTTCSPTRRATRMSWHVAGALLSIMSIPSQYLMRPSASCWSMISAKRFSRSPLASMTRSSWAALSSWSLTCSFSVSPISVASQFGLRVMNSFRYTEARSSASQYSRNFNLFLPFRAATAA
jgi:hypothetical protein